MVPPYLTGQQTGASLNLTWNGYRVTVPRQPQMSDIHAGAAVVVEPTPFREGEVTSDQAYLLVRGARSRRVAAGKLFAPVVTDDGFAALTSGSSYEMNRPISVVFWDARFRRLPDSPGVPLDFRPGERPIPAKGGVFLVEERTGRAFWCRPGRRAERLKAPGLIALAPGGARGVWWRGGRTTLATVTGSGAVTRPGRALWSRPDARPPIATFVPGGLLVDRFIDGPGQELLYSAVTNAGRAIRGELPPRPEAISADGTLWKMAGTPGKMIVVKWNGSRWALAKTFPPSVYWTYFIAG